MSEIASSVAEVEVANPWTVKLVLTRRKNGLYKAKIVTRPGEYLSPVDLNRMKRMIRVEYGRYRGELTREAKVRESGNDRKEV